jgi:hypothetical protein
VVVVVSVDQAEEQEIDESDWTKLEIEVVKGHEEYTMVAVQKEKEDTEEELVSSQAM